MEKNIEEPLICIREVNENFRKIILGEPLTRSLRVLNTSCKFRIKYENIYGDCGVGGKRAWERTELKNLKDKIICRSCFKEFIPKTFDQIYCSKKCLIKYHKKKYRKKFNTPKSK